MVVGSGGKKPSRKVGSDEVQWRLMLVTFMVVSFCWNCTSGDRYAPNVQNDWERGPRGGNDCYFENYNFDLLLSPVIVVLFCYFSPGCYLSLSHSHTHSFRAQASGTEWFYFDWNSINYCRNRRRETQTGTHTSVQWSAGTVTMVPKKVIGWSCQLSGVP